MRFDAPLAIVAATITGVVSWPFATIGINPHHDGIVLKPALDVLAGQRLFRDTFSQYGATPYLQALALRIFGPTLTGLRLSTVVMYALCAGVVVVCWRFFLPRSLSFLAWAVWLLAAPWFWPAWVLSPWSSVPALMFQLIALFCFLLAVTTPRQGMGSWLAGMSVGLVFLCRQPVGGVTFLALLAAFLWLSIFPEHRRAGIRCARAFILGFAAVMLVFLASLLVTDAVGFWYFETVAWPATWASGLGASVYSGLVPFVSQAWMTMVAVAVLLLPFRGLPRPAARRLAITSYVALLAAGIWLVCCATDKASSTVIVGFVFATPWVLIAALLFAIGNAIRSRHGSGRPAAWSGAVLLCLAAWLQVYPRLDPPHVFWAITPSVGFVTYAIWEASRRSATLTAMVLILVSGVAAPRVFQAATAKLGQRYVTLGAPPVLRGMRVPEEEARDWDQFAVVVGEYSRTHPDVAILVEGPDALYATFAPNLENPGPFFVVWPGLVSDGGWQRARFVTSNRPLIFRQALGAEALYFGSRASRSDKAGANLVDVQMRALRYVSLATIRGVEILAPAP